MIFKDDILTSFVLTLTCDYFIVKTSSLNWGSTHIWMPKPCQCIPYQHLLNQIQPYSHLDCNVKNRLYHMSQSCWLSWKRSLSNSMNNENITYAFIAYWTQRLILFCCTETNNILRAVLSNEDAVFSMRTFTCSWWLPVSLCRSAIGKDVEPYGLHLGTRLTSTCLQSRHLHEVGTYTRTVVFWIFFPLVPPHFVDWHRRLDPCHKSVSSDHRI